MDQFIPFYPVLANRMNRTPRLKPKDEKLPRLQKLFFSELAMVQDNILPIRQPHKLQTRTLNPRTSRHTYKKRQSTKVFKFLCEVSKELECIEGDKQAVYAVLVREYFDFFKFNHEQINSRLLLCFQVDPQNMHSLVSQEQFSKMEKVSQGQQSEQQMAEFMCKLFGLSNVLYVDISEFMLILKLLLGQRAHGMKQKERLFRGVVDILRAHNVFNNKRHYVSLPDLRSVLLLQRSTLLLMHRLIFLNL